MVSNDFYSKLRAFCLTLTALFSLSRRCGTWPPAELHPPGVKSGREVKELSSSSHFKDIKDDPAHTLFTRFECLFG